MSDSLDSTLLATKLYVPLPCQTLVLRPRLTAALSKTRTSSVTLVSAPAGYGKTTLISAWLAETSLPSTWLSLDPGDNDPIRFLQYFLLALQKVIPAIQYDLLSLVQGTGPAALEPFLNLLINKIAAHPDPFVIVLDDFHAIQDQQVLDIFTHLLKYLPPPMHLILISRTDPPLPLAHLRARNQLMEFRADQLRFTRVEIECFLNEIIGLDLSVDEISAMQSRTEGWIAGLQLAAISMQGLDDIHRFVTAFTGSHYYIMDYLTEEVFKRQPEKVRLFLLQSSILERICAPLCEAVVDPQATEQTGAQGMLEDLERMNLFLIPLDAQRRWYRYHHLFAEVLQQRQERLAPGFSSELHRRASIWFEQNGLIPEAIQHSLAAGDRERAVGLIEQNGILLLIRGEVNTLSRWMNAIEPAARQRPWLYIFRAWIFALTGSLDQVDPMLQTAEGLISALEPSTQVRLMQGAIAAARAHQANVRGQAHLAADFARQALEWLPDIDLPSLSLRAVATSLLGDASSIIGNLGDAWQAYMQSAHISQAAGDVHLTIVINSNLANILVEQGALHKAAEMYQETLKLATRPDGQKVVIAGRLYVELSQVYYEWNRLKEARQCVQESLALCKQWGNVDLQAVGCVMLAYLEQVENRFKIAQEAMSTAEQLVKDYDLAPRYARWVKSNLARLWIRQGSLPGADGFVQECGISTGSHFDPGPAPDGEIAYLDEPAYLVFLRLHLARGDYDTALELSQRLLKPARAAGRFARVIEVLVLQALALHGKKDTARALDVLGQAFALARPEGFTRVFLDEGEPLARLLVLAKTHQNDREAAGELLSAMQANAVRQPPVQHLIEPLTSRESEVFVLIEAGFTNQEIAHQLVISMPTVKRHISNIYTKLGAKNRTQAVSLAKELGLFEKK